MVSQVISVQSQSSAIHANTKVCLAMDASQVFSTLTSLDVKEDDRRTLTPSLEHCMIKVITKISHWKDVNVQRKTFIYMYVTMHYSCAVLYS